MLYWYDKCRKTRCGIPYNTMLNALKYIFPQRSFMVFFLSFFSPLALILVILTVALASLIRTRTKELMEILFLHKKNKIL